ncbi:ubiquitin elongating factor core-domain-containing protein [Phycomyces nitens]|nr:ubiquitin elongating factor core-domain-containing protein [Phycomyces nitens]
MDQEQLSDADKIRLKRVAKLQQQAEEQRRNQEQKQQKDQKAPEKRTMTPPQPLPSIEPESYKRPIKVPVSTATTSPPVQKPVPVPAQPSITKPVGSAKSFEDWQNDVLSRILQVTLDPEAAYKQGGSIYLEGMVTELEEEQEPKPFKLSQSLMDRVLVARLSLDPNESYPNIPQAIQQDLKSSHFDYLINCWKRAQEIKRNTLTRSKNLERAVLDRRLAVLDSVKLLLVSYSGLVLQIPDMFPQLDNQQHLGPSQLVSRLLAQPDTAQGLPTDYLSEMISRFADDGLDTILGAPLAMISDQVRKITILDNFKPFVQSLSLLCENKSVATVLPTLPEFDPETTNARTIEELSLLGPYFKLSAYPGSAPKVAENLFQNAENRNSGDLESCKNGVRGTIQNIQRSLFSVSSCLVRASATSREGLLAYFSHVLRLNQKRAQIQVDPQTVATDGFMHNVAAIMLTFCDPFLDVGASKVDKIDTAYFRTSRRIDIKEDTKINATEEQSDAYYSAPIPNKPHNFITEAFFITLASMHYGPIRSLVNYNELIREYNEAKKHHERAQQDAVRLTNNTQRVMQDFVAKRLKANLETMTMHKLAYESMVLDPEFLTQTMRFYNLVMAWMVRMVDPAHRHPWTPVKLPLPQDIPDAFSMLPEWIVEDIVEFFIFVGKFGYDTQVIKMNPQTELVTFIITFLRNTKYIKNPYLKAKFVEILFFYTYPIAKGVPGELEAMLNSHPLALEHLVPSLMTFYVEVEQTGASSQFYDKFNIRYNISHVMKTIWSHPAHRAKLREESRNPEVFTRFVNMLMSDVTYLLDESLSKLAEIHQIQTEMEDSATWDAQPEQQRQEREGQFRSLERQAQSYVSLGNETVNMLTYLTAEVVEPFLVNEIVDRLAAMLDYNLSQLVGPKCTGLNVKNRKKYHFEPRALLSQIIDIYLNLDSQTFIEAIARDGRSYRKEYFSKAASILLKHGLKQTDDIAALELIVRKVEDAVRSGAEEEEELGDVPDEYLDPLFFTLMEDPVVLPTSGVIVDRSTIRAHLLGDTRDPFNRTPLSMDMVQPGKDLYFKTIQEIL